MVPYIIVHCVRHTLRQYMYGHTAPHCFVTHLHTMRSYLYDGREGGSKREREMYDGKLFRIYTRNALTECLFADDGALLSKSQNSAETAIEGVPSVVADSGRMNV